MWHCFSLVICQHGDNEALFQVVLLILIFFIIFYIQFSFFIDLEHLLILILTFHTNNKEKLLKMCKNSDRNSVTEHRVTRSSRGAGVYGEGRTDERTESPYTPRTWSARGKADANVCTTKRSGAFGYSTNTLLYRKLWECGRDLKDMARGAFKAEQKKIYWKLLEEGWTVAAGQTSTRPQDSSDRLNSEKCFLGKVALWNIGSHESWVLYDGHILLSPWRSLSSSYFLRTTVENSTVDDFCIVLIADWFSNKTANTSQPT